MTVRLDTTLPCPVATAWDALTRVSTLLHVSAPVLRFRPVRGAALPERWAVGEPVAVRLILFGVLPLGRHHLTIERMDPAAGEVQSRERGTLVKRWDHLIRVRPTADGGTAYTDEIHISAGWLTPLVAGFAAVFYRHRQRRWRRLAGRLGRGEGRPTG